MDEAIVYRKRGAASALMLLFALAIGFAGYALVYLDQHGRLPDDWPWALGIWAGLGIVSWAVVTWRLPYADPLLLPCAFLLNGLGLAMIFRLDQAYAPVTQSARLQLIWTAVSVAALLVVVFFLRDHRKLQRFTYLWFALGLVILLMPVLPVLGKESHGARIWIQLGPLSFQPAEIAKIVLSVAFAAYLTEKRDVLAAGGKRILGIDLPRVRDLGPILIMWLASLAVLVLQTDLGTTLLFFGLFVIMIYVATQRPSWVILGTLMLAGMGVMGYTLFAHVRVRFESWLQPFSNYDLNYQVINAQFGIAWGGLFGTGWGLGRPYLTPLSKNDFIAAAIGEELGLFGLCAVIVVFGLIVARVLRASLAAREPFGKLLAVGLASAFGLQVFIIIGGVTRLLPLTGLTTPFVSQGGSSLIANYILLGLLLTVTHQVRRPQSVPSTEEYASLATDATQTIAAVGGQDWAPPTEVIAPASGINDPTELVAPAASEPSHQEGSQ
jgi:cell division protein FtsW (lipid II flippase)